MTWKKPYLKKVNGSQVIRFVSPNLVVLWFGLNLRMNAVWDHPGKKINRKLRLTWWTTPGCVASDWSTTFEGSRPLRPKQTGCRLRQETCRTCPDNDAYGPYGPYGHGSLACFGVWIGNWADKKHVFLNELSHLSTPNELGSDHGPHRLWATRPSSAWICGASTSTSLASALSASSATFSSFCSSWSLSNWCGRGTWCRQGWLVI